MIRKLASLGAVLVLALAVLGACRPTAPQTSAPTAVQAVAPTAQQPGPTTAPELVKIRLGISPFQDTMLPTIGVDKGWFKDEGLDVSLTTLAWNDVMTALASKSVDVAVNNTSGVISVANKAPEVIYWYGYNPFDQGAALMGNPKSGLKTVKDFEAEGMTHEDAVIAAFKQLKGKTVVTTMATDMGKAVVQAFQKAGLDYKTDAKIVDMDPDQGLAAFVSGTGDAFLGGIPQRTRATKEGMIVIASGPDLAPPPINGFVTTQDFANNNKDAMLRLQHVMFRIIRYCNDKPDECGKFITDQLNSRTGATMTVDDFKTFWQNWEHYALNANDVQKTILDPKGYSYWKSTWDNDNKSLFDEQHAIPAAVDTSHFWGDKVQADYVAKYGSNEQGY